MHRVIAFAILLVLAGGVLAQTVGPTGTGEAALSWEAPAPNDTWTRVESGDTFDPLAFTLYVGDGIDDYHTLIEIDGERREQEFEFTVTDGQVLYFALTVTAPCESGPRCIDGRVESDFSRIISKQFEIEIEDQGPGHPPTLHDIAFRFTCTLGEAWTCTIRALDPD
jgi:hypothetical protein